MPNALLNLQSPNHATSVQNSLLQGLEAGHKSRERQATRSALEGYTKTGDISASFNALLPYDPNAAFTLRDRHYKEETRVKEAKFNAATGRYVGSQGEDADNAFREMMETDPVAAFKIQSNARTAGLDRLKVLDGAYDLAIGHLANVTDDAGYQQVLSGMDERLKPLGVNIRDIAPQQYPGPEGVRALLMKAMNAQEQLSAIDRRDRFDADVADDAADNARDDKEAASREADRVRRAGIARNRETRMGQPKPAKSGKGATAKRPTASGEDGSKIEWDGSAWVPVK